MDAKNSSIECVMCRHTDRENRISRDEFKCGDEAHADMNAAVVLLERIVDRAEG